eukprot:m.256185 g.256185  ORF g.256185 m.256185 type:complete len:88 (-) comp15513_c2_seq8:529-792(-)
MFHLCIQRNLPPPIIPIFSTNNFLSSPSAVQSTIMMNAAIQPETTLRRVWTIPKWCPSSIEMQLYHTTNGTCMQKPCKVLVVFQWST